MSFNKLGLAMLTALALGAFMASTAFGADEGRFVTETSVWYVNGTKLASGGKKTLTSSAATTLKLNTTIANKQIEFEASGIECLNCTIENTGSGLSLMAEAHGELKFTGFKLLQPEPTVCSVGTTLITKKLRASVGMKSGSTTITTVRFEPAEGETFFVIEILGSSCDIKGVYKFTGTFFGEASNATGVFEKVQKLNFSKTIQESASSEATTFKFGGNQAYLTGSVNNRLSPEELFGTKKE